MSAKVVIVTGGTSGIGQATAELLASQGWQVVITGRREELGKMVVSTIKSKGGEATFLQSDVSSEDAVKAMIAESIRIYGRLDAAVNNAGIANDGGLFHELSTDRFREMIDVNVLGLFWCMKYELEHFTKSGYGSICNLASIAGLHAVKYQGSYLATKHAVMGMTRGAAVDYAHTKITINAVAPGAIRTDILNDAISKGVYTEEAIVDMFPTKRMGVPADIARAISFLLESPYATGSVVSVDGGYGA